MTDLLPKLLNLALDRAAPEGEAVAAFLRLRAILLGAGQTVTDFRKLVGEERVVVRHVERPPDPWSPILRFGKYRGRTVRDVAATEDGRAYLYWVLQNCERVGSTVKDAIREELGR